MKSISVVVLALNEEAGIARTVASVPREALGRMGYETQVVVVDGGSTDRTVELARAEGAEVVVEPIRGYGIPLRTGFAYSSGDIIATADGDATYPLEDLPDLVQVLEERGLEFITTNRFAYMDRGAMSFRNRVGNAVLTLSTRLLFGMTLRDSESGMWVFRRSILDRMVLRSNIPLSREIKIEACHYARCTWAEVPIRYRLRAGKVKHGGWRVGLTNLAFTFSKRIRR